MLATNMEPITIDKEATAKFHKMILDLWQASGLLLRMNVWFYKDIQQALKSKHSMLAARYR